MGADLMEIVFVLRLESLPAECHGNVFVFCLWIEIGHAVGRGITLKGFSPVVDAIVVDDEDDCTQLVTGKGLAFHPTEAECTVAHH